MEMQKVIAIATAALRLQAPFLLRQQHRYQNDGLRLCRDER